MNHSEIQTTLQGRWPQPWSDLDWDGLFMAKDHSLWVQKTAEVHQGWIRKPTHLRDRERRLGARCRGSGWHSQNTLLWELHQPGTQRYQCGFMSNWMIILRKCNCFGWCFSPASGWRWSQGLHGLVLNGQFWMGCWLLWKIWTFLCGPIQTRLPPHP